MYMYMYLRIILNLFHGRLRLAFIASASCGVITLLKSGLCSSFSLPSLPISSCSCTVAASGLPLTTSLTPASSAVRRLLVPCEASGLVILGLVTRTRQSG